MSFKYLWKNKEANFGVPIKTEVPYGTHISAELILKFEDKYVALRRPEAIPEHEIPEKAKAGHTHLYNVHGLPRWGENVDEWIHRLVKDQSGVEVKEYKLCDLSMGVYPQTQQWFIEPAFLVEIQSLPLVGTYGNQVTEVFTYDKNSVPDDFGWWRKEQIEEFLDKFDR